MIQKAKTRRQEERRKLLQKRYNKSEFTDLQFLRAIGAATFKTGRGRMPKNVMKDLQSVPIPEVNEPIPTRDEELGENTRYISDVGTDDEDGNISGLAPSSRAFPSALSTHQAKSKPTTNKGRSGRLEKPKCPECQKGFHFKRTPPLQIQCKLCLVFIHLRCLEFGFDEDNFFCSKCSPDNIEHLTEEATVVMSLSEAVTTTKPKPSYTDYPEELFCQRMSSVGLRRSNTDPYTRADGDCALWAALDGYNNTEEVPMFERDDTVLLR